MAEAPLHKVQSLEGSRQIPMRTNEIDLTTGKNSSSIVSPSSSGPASEKTARKMWSEVEKVGAEKHPNKVNKVIQYGTAGMRTRYSHWLSMCVIYTRLHIVVRLKTRGDLLDHVMYRMGVLAVLRSKVKGGERSRSSKSSDSPP